MDQPKILVVDDDGPTLALMRRLLRQYDLEAVTASSGKEAVDLARREKPRLVLLDLNMPGMNGREALEALRSEGLDAIPVVILSGDAIPTTDVRAMGAVDAIQKPFDLDDLIQRIRRHL